MIHRFHWVSSRHASFNPLQYEAANFTDFEERHKETWQPWAISMGSLWQSFCSHPLEDAFGTGRSVVPFPLSCCPVVPLSRVPLAVPVGGQRAAAVGERLQTAGILAVYMWNLKCAQHGFMLEQAVATVD